MAVALVPVDSGLLVVRRGIEPGRGKLALPGGYINYGESWQAACAREVQKTGADPRLGSVSASLRCAARPMALCWFLAWPRHCAATDLPAFKLDAETLEVLVIDRPVGLAFSLHTDAVAAYFQKPQRLASAAPADPPGPV